MRNPLIIAIIGGLVAIAFMKMLPVHSGTPETSKSQTAFERVISTHTLRCAYAAYDPFLIIGNDKHMSGIFHDVVEEAAKRLNLKVEWTEEVGYGNINTGFMTGRYDAFCAGLWPAGSRAQTTIFSRPVMWDPVSVWVRSNDGRFDGHMEKLNDLAYKIVITDGDATVSMANAFFPNGGRVAMSQNQTIGEELQQVTTGKADAMFKDYLTIDRFLKDKPGSVKDLSPGKPPLTYAATIGYNQGEFALRDMVDVVLDDMERDGTIGRIVKSYLGDKSNLVFHKQSQYEPY